MLATFTSTNPYAAVGDFLAIVTWGDDSDDAGPISIVQNEDGSFSVVGEHLYAEAGLYTLKVIVSDADGSTTDVSFTAAVSDAALTPTASSFSATEGVDPGSQTLATFIDDNPNPTLSDFSVLVKWGDGTTNASGDETGTVTIVQNEDGSFSIAGDHIYATAGSYDITVTITDVGGSSAFVVFTAQVKSS